MAQIEVDLIRRVLLGRCCRKEIVFARKRPSEVRATS